MREAFSKLLEEYGIKKGCYKIIVGYGREDVIKEFCSKANSSPTSIILVDSETPIKEGQSKLDHLKSTNYSVTEKITENNLFFMVVCMETWIVSDKNALKQYYGQFFKEEKIQSADLINRDKENIMKMLESSIKDCKENKYKKSASFDILKKVDVQEIVKSNSYAEEFFKFLKNK